MARGCHRYGTEVLYRSCRVLDELMVDGEKSEFQPVRNTEFAENVGEVMFDRLLAKRESLRDILVRIARNYCRHNLQLARSKAEGIFPPVPVGATPEGTESPYHVGKR